MKNKNLLLTFLTSLFSLVLIVPMFLDIFGYAYKTAITTSGRGFKIFSDYEILQTLNPDFNSLWSVVFDICLIVGLVLAGLWLIALILELLNVKLNYGLVKKWLGIAFVVLFVVALVSGILFMALNGKETQTTTLSITAQAGFYVALASMFVSGVVGFLASAGYKKAKRKRK